MRQGQSLHQQHGAQTTHASATDDDYLDMGPAYPRRLSQDLHIILEPESVDSSQGCTLDSDYGASSRTDHVATLNLKSTYPADVCPHELDTSIYF